VSNCLYSMMFICSKITRYEVLFIVALGLFTHVSCQFSFPSKFFYLCMFECENSNSILLNCKAISYDKIHSLDRYRF
jgi:hypothetical protein